MKGRKAVPTALKELRGNPGKRPINARELQPPVPARPPYATRHLSEDAKREWRRIVAVLLELGLYTELDHAALEMYCQSYGRWVHARRMIIRTGGEVVESDEGAAYYNQWYNVENREFEKMRKMLAEFGLTPSARSRLQIEPAEKELSLAEQLFQTVREMGSGE